MAGHLHHLSGRSASRLGAAAVVLLPVGAIEEHGPHLPLSVDFVIAQSVADAVVARLGDDLDVWALPALPFSKSNEHAWSPGTMWLSAATLSAVLDDLGRSIAALGVGRLAFLNGHGGNSSLLTTCVRDIRQAHDLLTFVLHTFPPRAYATAVDTVDTMDDPEHGFGIHGGLDETSLMLHLRPDLVDMSRAVRNVPEWLEKNTYVRFGGSVGFGWLSSDFGPDGHIGDPTPATPERGAELFDRAVASVCAQLVEVAGFDFPDRASR